MARGAGVTESWRRPSRSRGVVGAACFFLFHGVAAGVAAAGVAVELRWLAGRKMP